MNDQAEGMRRSDCPISVALDIFGDRWTLLVVRDLMLKGRKSFGDLLEGGERIASNILTSRLERLILGGLAERRRDPQDARRWLYELTPKGLALAPVLYEIILWSSTHEHTAAPPAEIEAMKRDREAYVGRMIQSSASVIARE